MKPPEEHTNNRPSAEMLKIYLKSLRDSQKKKKRRRCLSPELDKIVSPEPPKDDADSFY
jgi:hypothetical protein